MNDKFEPDWDESASWDEFEWEDAFKYSEHQTAQFFRMLERYGDLPNAETFIAERLGDHALISKDDDTSLEDFLEGWDEALEKTDKFPPGPGDSLYYEGCPVFQRARQISLGWCNILASVLSQQDRAWGMKILLYMGRILSYLSLSIGDGTFDRVDASTAFAKRTLHQINLILGELQKKTKTSPEYKSMFKLINDHLLETHDLVITYLNDCRKRKNSDFDK